MKYFAYGSNLCSRRLSDRAPSASFVAVAQLRAHVLRFHKVGLRDQSGKCDAFATGMTTDFVWGAVFELTADEKRWLDRVEGLRCGYVERAVEVESTRGRITATTYVASPDAIRPSLRPYAWYKDFVIAGSTEHKLPPRYVEAIHAIAAVEDPNAARAEKNRQILSGGMRPVHQCGRRTL